MTEVLQIECVMVKYKATRNTSVTPHTWRVVEKKKIVYTTSDFSAKALNNCENLLMKYIQQSESVTKHRIYFTVEFKNCLKYSEKSNSLIHGNGPLALRGYLTNAFFKQWVEILLMPKLGRAQIFCYTPNLWGKAFKGYILWHFDFFKKVIWFVLAAMLDGILLPSKMAANLLFACILLNFWYFRSDVL